MQAHRLEVARTARLWSSGDARSANEVWFLLHGYAQLAATMLDSCRALEARERWLVAPEALSRFYVRGGEGAIGATWMTREEREDEIADYVRYLDRVAAWTERELAGRAVTRVALGFSQGAATAWRWAALGTARIDRLITWGGPVPPDLDLQAHRERLAAIRVHVVHGSRDPLHTHAMLARDRERFASAAMACEWVEFDGPHLVDEDVLRRLIEPRAP